MAGENSILAGGVGFECRSDSFHAFIDIHLRTSLLFGNMPIGHISGYYLLDEWETEEETVPVFLLSCEILVALYRSCAFCCNGLWGH